jgi:hypothetical protein
MAKRQKKKNPHKAKKRPKLDKRPLLDAFAPAEELTLPDYVEKFVTLPQGYSIPGRVKLNKNRYLLRVLQALTQPWVRKVTFLKAVQCAGSFCWDLFLAWLIRVDPGPTMFNMQTDDDAKDHAKFRINPLLELCKGTAPLLPRNRHKDLNTSKEMQLMWLLLQGANDSNLQSKSTRYVGNDELAFWKKAGLTKDADARVTMFSWRSKIFKVSQAGIEGDEMDTAHKSGNREEFHWPCPACAKLQPFKWQYEDYKAKGGMKWLKNEVTCPNGEWNYDEQAKTIYYECRHCGHHISDTPVERQFLDENLVPVVTNPNAPTDEVSLRINAMYNVSIRWSLLVKEWCEAMIAYARGDIEPLKRFIQKRLAEPFGEDFSFLEGTVSTHRDYSLGDEWLPEIVRFIAIDKQKDRVYWVCRAFAANGESRLIECGCETDEHQVRAHQLRLGVPDDHVVEDAAHCGDEVYEFCCMWGWRALIGDDRKAWAWIDPNNPKDKRWLPFSRPQKQDPAYGYTAAQKNDARKRQFLQTRQYQFAIVCSWSNPYFKNFLQRLKSGRGLYWGIPKDIPQIYLDQLEGEKLIKVKEKWVWKKVGKKGDHYLDCERMLLVVAYIYGALSGQQPAEAEDINETTASAA